MAKVPKTIKEIETRLVLNYDEALLCIEALERFDAKDEYANLVVEEMAGRLKQNVFSQAKNLFDRQVVYERERMQLQQFSDSVKAAAQKKLSEAIEEREQYHSQHKPIEILPE